MTLANVSNQLLRSQGNDTTTVAANYPITGDGSTQLPLGLDEDYSGADGESLTFDIADITDGHRVTVSGSQGSSSFDVLNGQDGANGVNGVNGADGQSVTFDITNISNGHRVTLSGEQGSTSFEVMNGQNGVDGVSPTFRFAENADGITVIVSGAQGEDSFTLYNGEGGHSYSAGPNIDITDYTISGKDWTDDISAACQEVSQTIPDYSAGPNIDITNSTISGKDWTAEIESAISNVSGNYYPMTGNPSGFLTAHQDISNLMPIDESANFYPMTGNPSGFLTAIDLSNYYTKNETSSREEINAAIAAIPGAVDYSAGANIDITNHEISSKDWSTEINNAAAAGSAAATTWVSEQNYLTAHQDVTNLPYVKNNALDYTQSTLISGISGHELYAESANHAFTADTANYVASGWEYSSDKITGYAGSAFSAGSTYDVTAGANIDVTTAGNTFGISGKDWTDTITAASAYAASQAQGTEYTAGANIDITNHVISGKDWSSNLNSKLDTTTFNTYTAAHTADDNTAYTAGANINITNHVISSKNWTNDITAASSYAYSQATADAQGHTYTGVAPIVVNNTEDKISANCVELSAGNGIDSTKLATGVIEVSGGLGGGGVAISGQYVVNDSTITADCSAFCMYEQANSTGSYQLMATGNNASWHGYGYTMSKPENLLMDDVSSVAQNYAVSAVSSRVRLMNYPDITFSAVRDTFNAGGIVVPYETTQGYGTFYNFVASAVSASTSSYKFDYIGTNGYATVLTVSSENNGAVTGKVKNQSRIFLSPSESECKVVIVATSGDIPSSGATDNKLYVVTGT